MGTVTSSKAERAALILKNFKVEKLNAYYKYHKEIIDEFCRLRNEVDEADSNYITARINTMHALFPPPKKRKQ